MSIAGPASGGLNGAFLQEDFPAFMPKVETADEAILIGACQHQCQCPQLLPGRVLGVAGEIAGDGGHLVELAELNGYSTKALCQPSPSIAYDRLYNHATGLQISDTIGVELDRLLFDVPPIEVQVGARIPQEQDATISTEVGGIHQHDDLLRQGHRTRLGCITVQLTLNGTQAAYMLYSQLVQGLLPVEVLLPKQFRYYPCTPQELSTAAPTTIALDTSYYPVLVNNSTTAVRASFLAMTIK